MIRKILHSGLVMQILLLMSFAFAVFFTRDPERSNAMSTASLNLAHRSPPSHASIEWAAQSEAGHSASADDSDAESAELPFLLPTEGPGGPILVISSDANRFSFYIAEILRAEGLNYFTVEDVSRLTPHMLVNYDIVILGEMNVTESLVITLTDWVNEGGTLIAFKPSSMLAPLMGIAPAFRQMDDKYMLVHALGPGIGIVHQTIQFHGSANLHRLNGATSIATIYTSSTTPSLYPAVTTNNVGVNGGVAVAFTYDLAKSVVYTRQGNPKWAGQKRDGQIDPIRSDDLFFPDWIDLDKAAIPQADEQQRLLANIILQSNLHRKPLPRFWYLPRDLKAAIVMTGDDHATSATADRFTQYLRFGSNTPEDVANWKAVRATIYIFPNTPMTDSQAAHFEGLGFEIALHPNTNCTNYTEESLQSTLSAQLEQLAARFPSLSAPVTNRTHCLTWSDWASMPKTEVNNGIRLDASYYYWPASWVQNRVGMFTGSGIPMRFADADGMMIDNYQLTTQMTDESGIDIGNFCNQLLDKATGHEGYYGVFCANMHTDLANHTGSNAIIASAQSRKIPVISARQLLTWLDGRNNSFFSNINWKNRRLSFDITARQGAKNLRAMLPAFSESGQLVSVSVNGKPVSYITCTIKGMRYAFVPALRGRHSYIADYSGPVPSAGWQSAISRDDIPGEYSENPLNVLRETLE